MAAAPAEAARVARRVARGMTDEYKTIAHMRWETSYRGGWQNSTQKLQWFWFGFKKYGFLANLANMIRLREGWWETGEKRLIGMDALGHRYWETDDAGRTYAMGFRFIDYPHHVQFADQSKIPRKWLYYLKQGSGRSPPQLEALHKELGPDWRDYGDRMNKFYNTIAEQDTHQNPNAADGRTGGLGTFLCPWSSDFKTARDYYGHSGQRQAYGLMKAGFVNEAHVDEFDPKGGAVGKLALDGLEPDPIAQKRLQVGGSGDDKVGRFQQGTFDNMIMSYGKYDKSEKALALWWEMRAEEAELTTQSRAAVSAFDNPLYSSANTTGAEFGFVSRYKQIDRNTATGYAESSLHPNNHWRKSFSHEYGREDTDDTDRYKDRSF